MFLWTLRELPLIMISLTVICLSKMTQLQKYCYPFYLFLKSEAFPRVQFLGKRCKMPLSQLPNKKILEEIHQASEVNIDLNVLKT